MKKILATFLLSFMLLSVTAQTTFIVDGIKYNTTSDSSVAVAQARTGDYVGNIIIPSTVLYSGISYNVSSISDNAFYCCLSLDSITIPSSVASIGNYAFYCCKSLDSIAIPPSVTSIGVAAFARCESLTSIIIPPSVKSIGSSAFTSCTNLTSIIIPPSITSIDNYVFARCESLTSITIPTSVTSIGISAFYTCTDLTSMTIPPSVTSIGDQAFCACVSLSSITIPQSVIKIGDLAFQFCRRLTSITIPSFASSIGKQAFHSCTGLLAIHCQMNTPIAIDNAAFEYVNKDTCKLYVPIGTSNIYEATPFWNDFVNIIEESVTPVRKIKTNDIVIYSEQNDIVVKGVNIGETISVYSVSGVLVKSIKATHDVRIPVFPNQIYLVKAGNKTLKVAI